MTRIAIIGAGAAGIMAAIHAADAGAEVVLLEQTPAGGGKLLLTGGGRCNLLPANLDLGRFHTDGSPRTLRKILDSWPPDRQAEFFRNRAGIPLITEPDSGKIFPVSGRAREVRDRLFELAERSGAQLRGGTRVTNLAPGADGWRVGTSAGDRSADAVIIAAGGMSCPATGSDGALWPLLARLGHAVIPPYPALTPLPAADSSFAELAGVSLDAAVTAVSGPERATASGGFLFTHHGFSGPAVLEVSHIVTRASRDHRPARVLVNWTKEGAATWRDRLHHSPARPVVALLRERLPARLAEALCGCARLAGEQSVSQLRHADRERLIRALTECELPVTGEGDYAAAEVTGGGMALAEIRPATLESRKCPRLFIAGEMLDVFGFIGGNNLLWAWTTGRLAGLGAAGIGRG